MFTPVENRLGIQPIAQANIPLPSGWQIGMGNGSYGKQHPLGTIIKAYDPIFGEGEFIYLQMASTQVVGSLVIWNGYGAVTGDGSTSEMEFQAVLLPNAANQAIPVAVAMSAFPSGAPAAAFGWFQLAGNAVVATNGTAAAGPAFVGAVGQATSTVGAGKQILNANIVVANGAAPGPGGNTAVALIDRPTMQGQIT